MKKINSQLLSLLTLIIIVLGSCDYIAPPYDETNSGGPIDTTKYVRKLLVEDYTGHICPNCPTAAEKLTELEDVIYPGQIIPVAVHVSQLADPFPGPYYYNFKTPEGTEWDNFFAISPPGLPKGMVNRKGYPTLSHNLEYSAWASVASTIVGLEPDANIKIVNSFNDNDRTINTTVESKFLNNLSGDYKLCVIYVEDSIIQPQERSGVGSIPDYVHMHAMRGTLNGTWGELLATDPTASLVVTKQYSLIVKTDAVAKNCKVVAFIYNTTTYEIVQAEEKHFN